MHAFDNANNFVVHNLNQTEYRTSDVYEFKLLQDHVIKGAAHNSGERYDAPKCHPETRKAVLSSIKSWVDSSNETERVMWLHGPAGAGKSAIAQTTAEDCDKEGKLAASFFFSRLAGRNKKDGLIATIAYQLCVSIPAVKDQVIKNIERNPQIFGANIETQMHWLVVEPLRWLGVQPLHMDSAIGVIPRLVIIDGLDECENRKDQVEIIGSVSISLSSFDSISGLRVLLVSRPELAIRQAFNKDNISPLCTRIVLDDSFDPDKDIELYLKSHFQTIRREHTLASFLLDSWPSNNSITKLVAKSSGQFIYASTVIHFVSDPEHDPRKRLDTILNIRPPKKDDKPYAQLDELYSAILSMCKDYVNVAAIFEAIMFVHDKLSTDSILKDTHNFKIFLSLEDEIMLILANLHSIVDVNNIKNVGIRFYHASLFDYLVERSRSHAFYIDKHEGHVHLSMKCLHFLSNLSSEFSRVLVNFCQDECFIHFVESDCDDRILNYICKMHVLKPDNSQLAQISPQTSSHIGQGDPYLQYTDICISMLARLIKCVGGRKRVNSNVRDIIDDELVNHSKQYPRQDILYVLFLETSTMKRPGISIACKLHNDFMNTFKPEYMSIMRGDIFTNEVTRNWFFELMNDTGYIDKIPKDIIIKGMCCILDLAIEELHTWWRLNYIECFLQALFEQLPSSKDIYYALLEKWDTVKSVISAHDENFVSVIETDIRNYCKRVDDDTQAPVPDLQVPKDVPIADLKRVDNDTQTPVPDSQVPKDVPNADSHMYAKAANGSANNRTVKTLLSAWKRKMLCMG